MEVTVENIEKALQQFYQNASCQREVHQWLTALQCSQEAWTFCWALLSTDKSPEVQFFGANCLHVKISKFWHEVPQDQYDLLRARLFEHIVQFAEGPRMVRTRLCVALSAFTLHMTPAHWPDAVHSIITTFQTSQLPNLDCEKLCLMLLEILTVLPEEFPSCSLMQHQKGVVRNELQKGAAHVLQLLDSLMSPSHDKVIYEHALKCFSSWVHFGIPPPEIEALVVRVFEALGDSQLFDTAIEALVSVFSHQENHRYPGSIERLLPHILGLQGALQQALQEHDMDQCQSLIRLIVTAGDANTKLIVACSCDTEAKQQMALGVVKLLLVCTGLPGVFPVEESCSDLSFGFWYNLQDDIAASDSAKFPVLTGIFIPLYMNLVDVLLQKLQYPSEEEYNSWNADEKEQHRCYRTDIADTLMYAYNFLNKLMLANLVRLLQSIINKAEADQVRWQEVEAILFAVTSIAECVDFEENTFLPALFQMLGSVPCTHHLLVTQAMFLIGAYAEWISSHPEVLGHVLPLMLQGLHNAELAQPASLALKEVVRENQEHLGPFLTQILTASKAALDSGVLRSRDAVRLMGCVGYVLSVLPVNEIMEYLTVLLSPHLEYLQSNAVTEATASSKAGIILRINMLAWLFSSLNIYWRDSDENQILPTGPQPVLLVLQNVLPILRNVMVHWVNDVSIVECVCDMYKRAVRTLMDDFADVAEMSSQFVVEMFTASPHAIILDLAKQMLVLYASDAKYTQTGSFLFYGMCNRCFAVFESGIRDHPDIAENFMSFLAQVAKKNSNLFLEENCDIVKLFQTGVISLGMPEGPTVKSACQFLSELINCSEKNPRVRDVIKLHGHSLVDRLLRAVGGESPRTIIDSTADVFLALNCHHFQLIQRLLQESAHQDGFPNARATKAEKEKFASRVLKERVNKRRLKETLTEYTLLWRGLLGTEYGAQTSSIKR